MNKSVIKELLYGGIRELMSTAEFYANGQWTPAGIQAIAGFMSGFSTSMTQPDSDIVAPPPATEPASPSIHTRTYEPVAPSMDTNLIGGNLTGSMTGGWPNL